MFVQNLIHIPSSQGHDGPPDALAAGIHNEVHQLMLTNTQEESSPASTDAQPTVSKRQNQILWNLFSQNLDTVIINLIASPHHAYW